MQRYLYIVSGILYILTALVSCTATGRSTSPENENFETPPGFDTRKAGVLYGEEHKIGYYSTTTENERNAIVILPPGYNQETEYPVLYLLHGIGGDENEWLGGHPAEIIGNLTAEGKTEETIIVIPNIRARHKNVETPPEFFSIEHFREFNAFLQDMQNNLKPWIEANYAVKTGRENTAIAGLSMGGRSALHIGISLPDQFGYIGAFTPAVGLLPYPAEEGLFTKESLTLPGKYKENTLIMIVKGKDDEVVGEWPEEYSQTLKQNGVEHIYYETPGGHDFTVWKNSLYNFAKSLFR
ncbi:MAG: hypothetical protein LUH10_11715 [Tannerellaceae bacterium]|nr:hypothetical protein [Tannerellaceae bacterium]